MISKKMSLQTFKIQEISRILPNNSKLTDFSEGIFLLWYTYYLEFYYKKYRILFQFLFSNCSYEANNF